MDYEKAYKEALERARKINNGEDVDVEAGTTTCEYIFPELAESEDEKIRKMLIDSFTRADMGGEIYGKGVTYKQVIAWLEKQGQTPYGQRKECLDCQFNYAGECKGFCQMKRDEQNPADEVEPNFHEGDWVVYNNDICQIARREEGCNKLVTIFGIEKELVNERNLSTARLWTIRDAKDGDVLFAENFDNIGGCVFLFNGLDSLKFDAEGDRAIATGYCCTSITESGNTDFGIQGPDCIEIKRVHPATKSQRDLLFQKMHEAGYEWDAEKKELKLLITNGGDFLEAENCEQKPIDYNEELKKCRENPLYFIDKYVKLQPKQVWSEEDEKNWRRAIRATQVVYPEAADWLKFLKDKYIWKPSNEQMEVLLSEVNSWKKGCPKQIVLESLYNDLKKLK